MDYIAIDVGSGLCKFSNKQSKSIFPSIVGKSEEDDSFKLGLEDYQLIKAENEYWMTGAAAQGYVNTGQLATTTKQSWSETKAHLILLYSAIAYLYPEGFKGDMYLVTGLPMKKYINEVKQYKAKLTKTHKFTTPKSEFEVTFKEENTLVIPQVIGLHFSNILKNKGNWQESKVGYIDPGTQTTGWAVMEDAVFQKVLSGGEDVGMIKLAREIKGFLKAKYDWEPRDTIQILKALRKGYIEIFENGVSTRVDLVDVAQQYIPIVYKQVIKNILEDWSNARDMKVVVSSGGGKYLINTLKKHIPHATLLHKELKNSKVNKSSNDPIFDVVEGYSIYAENKWR